MTEHQHDPAADEQRVIISARHLSKVYLLAERKAVETITAAGAAGVREAGGFVAVDDVSFDVKRGEIFAIMGLSGSGKSTVIRMLNRLIEPTVGEICVDGANVAAMDAKSLRELRNRKINMVFQHFALLPHRSLVDNVAYGLKVRGVDKQERRARALTALEQVGLADRADRLPSALSGGQRQRVGLARALATNAEVLLMDEPFSALDPLIRKDMQNLLLQLQEEFRKTIIFVTHDLNEAMRLGDRIMIMKQGRCVQLDKGPALLANPADDYVSDFIADVDRPKVLRVGDAMRPATGTVFGGVTVHVATFLCDAIAEVTAHDGPVAVVDDDGTVVGEITASSLLHALAPSVKEVLTHA
jgi:glycine betaine/proline transport system ATP-binding protein